jgi:geranylgeranyl pyrophosphate synthase
MLHNASLLVDDIEDNSILRRGIPVAHKIYGTASTINSANYVMFIGKATDAARDLHAHDNISVKAQVPLSSQAWNAFSTSATLRPSQCLRNRC